jgi:hypothetical protein
MRKRGAAWVLAVALAAGAASADGLLYDCDITERNPRADWISAKFAFVVNGGAVSVVDNIILTFEEAPAQAHVRQRGDALQLNWTVNVRDARRNTARMSYRARLDLKTKAVEIKVRPVGYPQSWSGKGQCSTRRP